MNEIGQRILGHLAAVQANHRRREADPTLAAAVLGIKRYQHDRFQRTYADLLAHPRYADTARFFLDELYGPHDFRERDAQFVRVVPTLVRLFPDPLCDTVARLTALHELSEALDTAMGAACGQPAPDAAAYAQAWRQIARPADRLRQIELMLDVGRTLDRYTRKPGLRQGLHLMRRPAAAAGLGDLQQFLETGFDTFARMKGAEEFLSLVAERETALARHLDAGGLA